MSAVEEAVERIVVPDSIEPYVGVKYLHVVPGGRLFSSAGRTAWPEGEPLCAECVAPAQSKWVLTRGVTKECWSNNYPYGPPVKHDPPAIVPPNGMAWSWEEQPHNHDAPSEECNCGIHAVDDEERCRSYKDSVNSVLVELAIWGKVIPGDYGVRGQYAYPQRIFGDSAEAKAAAERYGVPLVTSDNSESPMKRRRFPWVPSFWAGLVLFNVAAAGLLEPVAAFSAFAAAVAGDSFARALHKKKAA